MKITTEYGDAVRVKFPCPASPLTKFAKVATVLTAIQSQTETSITFAAAPANLAAVDIYYGNDIVIPPAVYTVSGVGATMLPPPLGAALTLFLNVTAASGTTPSLACKVQQLDLISGAWIDVTGAVFAAVSAPGVQTLAIFSGAAAVVNASVNQQIRNQYRISYAITGTTPSFTFSIGAQAF